MGECCPKQKPESAPQNASGGCCPPEEKKDWLFTGTSLILTLSLILNILPFMDEINVEFLGMFPNHVSMLLGKMWWSLTLSVFAVGLIGRIPGEFVFALLGNPKSKSSIFRAAAAGILLDLCNHGILLVGMKLYKKGASFAQTLAFLIASPWNSLSVTLILFSLIGIKWTLIFIALSYALAVTTGFTCMALTKLGFFPENETKAEFKENFKFLTEAKQSFSKAKFDKAFFKALPAESLRESRMILRWIFLGIVLTALMKTFMSADQINVWLGPTLSGLGLTLVLATIIEVCSEGGSPIAAEIFTSGRAPGNSFVFLMSGVSTDATEILSLKSTTGFWKMAFALPVITVPKILLIGWLLNMSF